MSKIQDFLERAKFTSEGPGNDEDAYFIAAAKNAADDIKELTKWFLLHVEHVGDCDFYNGGECTCGYTKIRELVEE